jgi:hypothetical protein
LPPCERGTGNRSGGHRRALNDRGQPIGIRARHRIAERVLARVVIEAHARHIRVRAFRAHVVHMSKVVLAQDMQRPEPGNVDKMAVLEPGRFAVGKQQDRERT